MPPLPQNQKKIFQNKASKKENPNPNPNPKTR
jgi:hypothetical protein